MRPRCEPKWRFSEPVSDAWSHPSRPCGEAPLELHWYWGEPYIKLIGRDRLLAAPWAKVEESTAGDVFTWVTDDPNDPLLTDYTETQLRIEAATGRNLFPEDPYDPKCRTPRFDLSELTVPKPKGIRD